MSFEVGVVAEFQATHALRGDFGPASQRHGHQYRVEAFARGAALLPDGTLFDITRLQQALAEAIGDLDGRELNDVAELAEPNPTAEVLARYLCQRLAPALRGQGLQEVRVRVWESPEAWAGYALALD